MDLSLYWLAFSCFAAAFVLHLYFLKNKNYLSRRFSLPIMGTGFALLTIFMYSRGSAVGACPIGNPFEIIVFIFWTSLLIYLLVALFFSVNYLGFFSAGMIAVAMVLVRLFPALDYAYGEGHINSSAIVGMHASLAVFSYGVFALLSVLGIMYLVQFYGLSKRRTGSFFTFLPSLTQLEHLQTWVLSIGLFLLTLSLFVGSFIYLYDLGEVPHYKLSFTVLVWLMYFVFLVLRLLKRLFSSKYAWSVIIGFLVALLALIPVDRARHDLAPHGASEIMG